MQSTNHLGNASWITDATGIPIQHIQYCPYGNSPLREIHRISLTLSDVHWTSFTFVDQHTGNYTERFTFTGKERDAETGYHYFGARYLDATLMAGWLSVDPMSDKYPSLSPYNYCAWNPVKIVDPKGDSLYNLDQINRDQCLRSIFNTLELMGSNQDKLKAWQLQNELSYEVAEFNAYSIYANKTQCAIEGLKMYAPDEYRRLNQLKDQEQTDVNVFVSTGRYDLGQNVMGQCIFDVSNYSDGTYSVSANVRLACSGTKRVPGAVLILLKVGEEDLGALLAHEGGHAEYAAKDPASAKSWESLQDNDIRNKSGRHALSLERAYCERRKLECR